MQIDLYSDMAWRVLNMYRAHSGAKQYSSGFMGYSEGQWQALAHEEKKVIRLQRLLAWADSLKPMPAGARQGRPFVKAMPERDIGPFGALLK